MHIKKRKCRNCNQFFSPCPSAHHHQRYCSSKLCQQARKAVNNRQFRKANPDYHKGSYHVNRVREWRQKHPGYWRHEKRNGGPGRKAKTALQVVQKEEPIENKLVALQEALTALQAVSNRQHFIFQGLAAQLTGSALQAELVPVLDAWYDRGKQFGGFQPLQTDNASIQETCHEKTSNSLAPAGKASAHSPSL